MLPSVIPGAGRCLGLEAIGRQPILQLVPTSAVLGGRMVGTCASRGGGPLRAHYNLASICDGLIKQRHTETEKNIVIDFEKGSAMLPATCQGKMTTPPTNKSRV